MAPDSSLDRPLLLDEPTRKYHNGTAPESWAGFLCASIFSVAYVAAPIYILAVGGCLVRYPLRPRTWMLVAPVVLSLLIPMQVSEMIGPSLMKTWGMSSILKYFNFEEYHEITDGEIAQAHKAGKRFIFCSHPHGVFSFCGLCAALSATVAPDGLYADGAPAVPSAAASVISMTPFLRNILGIWSIIDVSNKVLTKRLLKPAGSVVIYVGGIIELFSSSPKREAVYLKKRKGFVKLALKTGADLVPVYLFGNTTVLSVLTAGPLAALSRKVGVSVTMFWGRFGLPMPKRVRLSYVRGRPIGLPHIPEPTQEDIDKWHAEYCKQLVALFDKYKGSNPDYKHKELVIE